MSHLTDEWMLIITSPCLVYCCSDASCKLVGQLLSCRRRPDKLASTKLMVFSYSVEMCVRIACEYICEFWVV